MCILKSRWPPGRAPCDMCTPERETTERGSEGKGNEATRRLDLVCLAVSVRSKGELSWPGRSVLGEKGHENQVERER
jgi:hypothetical protein